MGPAMHPGARAVVLRGPRKTGPCGVAKRGVLGLHPLRAANVSVWLDEHRPDPGPDAAVPADVEGVRLRQPLAPGDASGLGLTARRLAAAIARGPRDAAGAYVALLLTDARATATALLPRYERRPGADGLVEFGQAPDVARSAQALVAGVESALRALAAPNVLVGLPGTAAGLLAVQELTFRGISTAVDGVFCAERHHEVAEAYLRGLERRLLHRLPLDGIASVTWTPVAAISREADRLLPDGSHLRGVIGPTVAQSIYVGASRQFSGPRWRRLAGAGASPMRPGFRELDGVTDLRRLLLPGSVLALSAQGVDDARRLPDLAPGEVDETEVVWLLREATRSGLPIRVLAARLRRARQERAAFAHRSAVATLADALWASDSRTRSGSLWACP